MHNPKHVTLILFTEFDFMFLDKHNFNDIYSIVIVYNRLTPSVSVVSGNILRVATANLPFTNGSEMASDMKQRQQDIVQLSHNQT